MRRLVVPLAVVLLGPAAVVGSATWAPTARAQQATDPAAGKIALAVLPFANQTGDSAYDALGKGLADMLTTDLSAAEGLTLVERSRLQDLLDELALADSGFVDPQTAATVGRGLGARYVLTGAISAVAPQMRLDARVISVETGEVVDAAETTGPTEEFFLLEKELAELLSDELGVTLSARERARMGRVQTESFAAFQAWSAGLDALDRGELDAARDRLQAALDADDRFEAAEAALSDAQARLDASGARSNAMRSERNQAVFDALSALQARGGATEAEVVAIVSPNRWRPLLPLDARDVHAVTGLVLDLGLPDSARMDVGGMQVNEWALAHRTLAALHLRRPTEVVTVGQELLDRFPATSWAPSLQQSIQGELQTLKEREAGQQELPLLRKQARFTEHYWTCTADLRPEPSLAACEAAWAEVQDLDPVTRAAAGSELLGGAIHAGQHARARAVAAELRALVAEHAAEEEVARKAERGLRWLEKLDDTLEDIEEQRPRTESPRDGRAHARLAELQARAGLHDEAEATIDAGLAAFPADPDLLQARVRHRVDLHDHPGAVAALEAWAAAVPEPQARLVGEVERLPEAIHEAGEGRARALDDLADDLNRRSLFVEAGEVWLVMAREEAAHARVSEPNMLVQAGWNFSMGGRIAEAREIFEEVLARFPEEQAAETARIHLGTLPL